MRGKILKIIKKIEMEIGEIMRSLDVDMYIEIEGKRMEKKRNKIEFKEEMIEVMSELRKIKEGMGKIKCRKIEMEEKRRSGNWDRKIEIKVREIKMEELVRIKRKEDIEIKRR